MALTMKAARVNANLTQEEACKKIGISKSTLQNMENYKVIPKLDLAQKIAEVYGLTIDDIIFYKQKSC